MSDQTLGEKRVRTKFNPSEDSLAAEFKNKTAELINLLLAMKDVEMIRNKSESGELKLQEYAEYNRLLYIAEEKYETAVMYAVKAATFFPEELSPFKK